METPTLIKLASFFGGGLLLCILSFSSCAQVDEGNRGIELVLGEAKTEALDPGIHLKWPFISKVKQMDVKEKNVHLQTTASSKDLQVVTTTMSMNVRPKHSHVVTIYSTLSLENVEWSNVRFNPAIQEVTKSVTARYTAAQLVTLREEVKNEMTLALSTRLSEDFDITQVSITDFEFGAVFQHSIEEKQKAEQDALKAENNLRQNGVEVQMVEQKAKSDATANRLRAQGNADAIMIKAQAFADSLRLKSEALSDYHQKVSDTASAKSLRALEIESWDGKTPSVVGNGGNVLLPLPQSTKL